MICHRIFCCTIILIITAILCTVSAIGIPKFNYIGERQHPTQSILLESSNIPQTPIKWTLENVKRITDSTDQVTIAYFLQISDSTISLTPRLLSRIHHPQNFYALHFDKKIAAYRVVKIISDIKNNPLYKNVHIMEREPITYRGVSMVLNTLSAITDLLKNGHWDYFINLSGSDYPLVSPTMQRKILALPFVKQRESNFFTISSRENWERTRLYRFSSIATDTALGMTDQASESQLVILNQQNPLYSKLNYEYVQGEAWFILTRKACKFMIESAYARKMLLSMAYSQESSEHYYVSLFWNHPQFNKTIVNHSMRTVFWKLNGIRAGQHPFILDQQRNQNGTYSAWQKLKISPHFFARKFSIPNGEMMDWIDNEMNGFGQNLNDYALNQSLQRVETHLHWLYNIKPENKQ